MWVQSATLICARTDGERPSPRVLLSPGSSAGWFLREVLVVSGPVGAIRVVQFESSVRSFQPAACAPSPHPIETNEASTSYVPAALTSTLITPRVSAASWAGSPFGLRLQRGPSGQAVGAQSPSPIIASEAPTRFVSTALAPTRFASGVGTAPQAGSSVKFSSLGCAARPSVLSTRRSPRHWSARGAHSSSSSSCPVLRLLRGTPTAQGLRAAWVARPSELPAQRPRRGRTLGGRSAPGGPTTGRPFR